VGKGPQEDWGRRIGGKRDGCWQKAMDVPIGADNLAYIINASAIGTSTKKVEGGIAPTAQQEAIMSAAVPKVSQNLTRIVYAIGPAGGGSWKGDGCMSSSC